MYVCVYICLSYDVNYEFNVYYLCGCAIDALPMICFSKWLLAFIKW